MKPYVLLSTRYAGYTTYGVGYVQYDCGRPILIETYPDLSHDREPVMQLVRACNRAALDPHALRRAVEEFLESR